MVSQCGEQAKKIHTCIFIRSSTSKLSRKWMLLKIVNLTEHMNFIRLILCGSCTQRYHYKLGVEACFVKLQPRLYLTMSVNFIICRLSLNDIYYSYDLKVWFCVHFWLGFYFVCSFMKSKFCYCFLLQLIHVTRIVFNRNSLNFQI